MRIRSLTIAAALIAPPLATATPAGAADTFKVDAVHSAVIFQVRHMGVSDAFGRFNDIGGTFSLDEKDPAQSTFDFTVKTASIDTASSARDKHLSGPDFFNVKQFPTITFKSKSVKKLDKADYEVVGDLTLHGVTRPITIKLTKVGEATSPIGHRAGLRTTFAIKRTDYGMKGLVAAVGDDVNLIIGIEGVAG